MPGYMMHHLVQFGRILRREGLAINPGRMVDLYQAIGAIDIGKREDFYYVCRILLIQRHEDFALFDKLFHRYWRGLDWRESKINKDRRMSAFVRPMRVPPAPQDIKLPEPNEDDDQETGGEPVEMSLTYSSREELRQKDFAKMAAEEIAEVKQLIAQLNWQLGERRTRRQMPGSGPHLDLRRSLRRNLRYGGEMLEWERWSPKYKHRPLVILADISGSMEPYTGLFLHFMHSLSWGLSQRVEVFVFGTRLTRITRQLRNRHMDRALRKISQDVHDWSGGTRIGEALRKFNIQWARRVMASRAVVLFISDGWDRGDPAQMGREMARLQRSCHRLIWLNPLLGSPEFEPLTRGTQTALGYIDDFLPVHNLSSLENLAVHLAFKTFSSKAKHRSTTNP